MATANLDIGSDANVSSDSVGTSPTINSSLEVLFRDYLKDKVVVSVEPDGPVRCDPEKLESEVLSTVSSKELSSKISLNSTLEDLFLDFLKDKNKVVIGIKSMGGVSYGTAYPPVPCEPKKRNIIFGGTGPGRARKYDSDDPQIRYKMAYQAYRASHPDVMEERGFIIKLRNRTRYHVVKLDKLKDMYAQELEENGAFDNPELLRITALIKAQKARLNEILEKNAQELNDRERAKTKAANEEFVNSNSKTYHEVMNNIATPVFEKFKELDALMSVH
jgi:hypothetical protein